MHILVLTDRDWSHPQGGGTGTHLRANVVRWLELGNRVTIIACGFPGALPLEREGDLTVHRLAGRVTVFPTAIWRQARGLVPDADVVLEVINGITFLTPLWLRTPRVALIHHVHRPHYIQEMGRVRGSIAAAVLETLPLKLLYRRVPFLTVSDAAAADVAAHGMDRDAITVHRNGVDSQAFPPGERASQPTLLFLGRLKRYKRIECLLDVVARTPEVTLEIAGDGDHRAELERAVAERGLAHRVRFHGHVSEARKLELLQQAWVNVTASSNEGWCLTIMEAGCCQTPSVAMAVGGLKESVADGDTGLLARDMDEFTEAVQRLVRDGGLRQAMGRRARERAGDFDWARTADGNLAALRELGEPGRAKATRGGLRSLASSDTGRAAGLASAVIAANLMALVFTVVFARLLGAPGYGSLAALLSAFIILMVPGSALQIAVSREVSQGRATGAGMRHWLRRILVSIVVVTAAAVPARELLGSALNVDQLWGAALVPISCALWMLVCVERGALQGLQRYRLVGGSILVESIVRLAGGVCLVAAGMGVTGAFLATPLALAVVAAALARPLLAEMPDGGPATRLRTLLSGAWIPVLGLTLLFALQEIHVIVVKHEASAAAAGSYAVAAVAAKGIIWVAVGLGMYLLPEAARRAKEGVNPRPVLLRTLPLIGAVALPMLLVYAFAAEPLLRLVFGTELTGGAGALPWLGLAMALLACSYLSVQYLLALGRARFMWVLAPAAAAEVVLLALVGADLTRVALALSALQLVCAAAVLAISVRTPTLSA